MTLFPEKTGVPEVDEIIDAINVACDKWHNVVDWDGDDYDKVEASFKNAATAIQTTRQANTTLERVKQLREWTEKVFTGKPRHLAQIWATDLLAKIDNDFPELLEGQSKETG